MRPDAAEESSISSVTVTVVVSASLDHSES
jgi:hypothetical protein